MNGVAMLSKNTSARAMDIFEVQVPAGDASDMMAAVRTWLDQHGIKPVMFHYHRSPDGMVLGIRFRERPEAEQFAQKFGGVVVVVAA